MMVSADDHYVRPEARQLQYAAVAFATLGVLLYKEPEKDLVAFLVESDFFDDVPFGNEDPSVLAGQNELASWLAAAKDSDLACVADELRREWLRLLVGYGEPAAPPWATYYFDKDHRVLGKKSIEVRQWYARYGMELERKYREPDDHLGLMLQFLSIVVSREAESVEKGDTAEADRLCHDADQFIRKNMLPWVSHWQNLVAEDSRSAFYRGIALLVIGCLQAFVDRLDAGGRQPC